MFDCFRMDSPSQNIPQDFFLIRFNKFATSAFMALALLSVFSLAPHPGHSNDELLTDELLTDELLLDEDLDGDLLADDLDNLLPEDDDLSIDNHQPSENAKQNNIAAEAALQHEALFAETRFPSASTCGTCHPKHYAEWSISQHSYSQLSPVYLSLSNKINQRNKS